MSIELNFSGDNKDIHLRCECGEFINLSDIIKQEESTTLLYFCTTNVADFKDLVDALALLAKKARITHQSMLKCLNEINNK